jgi:hypothetical protein
MYVTLLGDAVNKFIPVKIKKSLNFKDFLSWQREGGF